MKTMNAIATSVALASFALLGTWATTVGHVDTQGTALRFEDVAPCPYEDQSSGTGGQAGKCTFTCETGKTTLEVSADDDSALVSGTASCAGDAVMHCNGDGSCSTSVASTSGGDGACSGDSDEFWDSGFYVNCSSNSAQDIDDPDVGDVCPAVLEPSPPYPRICSEFLSTTYDSPAGEFPLNLCLVSWHNTTLCDAPIPPRDVINATHAISEAIKQRFEGGATISAHLFVEDGAATALVCWGYDCKQVLPTVMETVGSNTVRWSVT